MVRLLLAVLWDTLVGDPPNWPHPVRFIGWIVKRYEKIIRMAFTNLYVGGFVLLFAVIATFVGPLLWVMQTVHPLFLNVIEVVGIGTLLATKCLVIEGKKMAEVLKSNDLIASRKALSYLVGRDTDQLTEEAIVKATVETLSENTIDGVLAPLFYAFIGFFFGMPLVFVLVYKIVNTLDSMVGYIQKPYTEIGYASAKCDDWLNFIPARLGAIVILLAGGIKGMDFRQGVRIFLRDRLRHKSPNSGHPESVVAGLLGISLGGTSFYFGEKLEKPTIGNEIVPARREHISATIELIWLSVSIAVFLFAIVLWTGGVR